MRPKKYVQIVASRLVGTDMNPWGFAELSLWILLVLPVLAVQIPGEKFMKW